MKTKLLSLGLVFLLLITQNLFSQDHGFNYQAVARDNNGDILANTTVNLRFQIVSGSQDGPIEYQETFSPSTNDFGLVNLVVGTGSAEVGDFSGIDWSTGEYYLIIEMNGTKIDTTRFESVPYSKVATNMSLMNLRDVASLNPNSQQVLSFDGTEWMPSDLPVYTGGTGIDVSGTNIINTMPDQEVTLTGTGNTNISGTYPDFTIESTGDWSATGTDIFFNSGNVGIGNDNPSSALTIGSGPALTFDGGDGDLAFGSEQGSIFFPQVNNTGSAPMIYFFSGGTQNESRMIFAHSPAFDNYGLKYDDSQDAITWIGSDSPAFYLHLDGNREIGFGTDNPEARMHIVNGNNLPVTQLIQQETSVAESDIQVGSQIYVENSNSSTTGPTYGAYVNSFNVGGAAVGVFSYSMTSSEGTDVSYAVRALAENDNGSGMAIGVYSSLAVSSTTGAKYAGYFAGDIYASGSYLPSDAKLKKGLLPVETALEKILDLKVEKYTYRKNAFSGMHLPGGEMIGFTSQNVKTLMPELVKSSVQPATTIEDINAGMEPSEDIHFEAVNYTGMIPYLVKSIQEQQQIIERKDAQLKELQSKFSELEQRLSRLESMNR